ncbi:LysR substrate-binding domain-containing protein [Marinobacterium ramblicola]|uniref:LysR substrate-binding domain-containing protein n=1 Tax=Marinobacterium ramblicola TaxID=2849041 RepID=UPI001C2D8080
MNLKGKVRLGLQEDFGEQVLTQTLGRFKRAYPGIQIEVVVARNAELVQGMRQGQLDLALAWDDGHPLPNTLLLCSYPMRWIGARDNEVYRLRPLPLILFDAPCMVRQAALDALNKAGIPWHISMTSRSLAGIWAATQAGLGLTVRTAVGMPSDLQILAQQHGLPALPSLKLVLHRLDSTPPAAVKVLESCLLESLDHVSHPAG